jgi:hypothetical protein
MHSLNKKVGVFMSKLVIQTQYRENYSFDDEGYPVEGADAHWKYKGGTTYVVEGLSGKAVNKIAQHGIPTLSKLIAYKNDASEEYILDWNIEEDDAVVCEEWETPIMLEFDSMLKVWRATKITINGDMGYMRSEIAKKQESWIMHSDLDREDYRVLWTMEDGHSGIGQEFLTKWFADKETA